MNNRLSASDLNEDFSLERSPVLANMSGPSTSTTTPNAGRNSRVRAGTISGISSAPTTPVTPSSSSRTTGASTSSGRRRSESGNGSTLPILDDRILRALTTGPKARKDCEKTEAGEHKKRMKSIRKELKYLRKTEWKYESIDKILGD